MQFPIVNEYKTDIKGTNPENKVPGEPIHIESGEKRVFVPRHAPFFVDSLELYAPNGAPLNYDEHYRILTLMPGLTALAGKPVAALIELLDPDLEDFVVDYHTMGEFPLFDTSLLQLIEAAANDNRPIYWNNIRNKPTVFPPTLHQHSLIYGIVGFQDMVAFLNDIVVMLNSNYRNMIEARLDHYLNLVQGYIQTYGNMLTDFRETHQNAHDAHGLRAIQVGLENVDNFKTSRISNVLQGREDLHLTPVGLRTIVERHGFDENQFLPVNKLPISQFGNSNFIPPSIDGSFEGLGGARGCAGICMESDGTLVYLSDRLDGRTKGLYYTMWKQPFTDANQIVYTSYRYVHPRLEVDNANADFIMNGSGNEVILVGDIDQGFFYIGLTNGTLDPAKHVYSKINLSALTTVSRHLTDLVPLLIRGNIFLAGDWIYIVVRSYDSVYDPVDFGFGMRYYHFFRVPVASVETSVDVTATLQQLTYMDADGVQWNNSNFWRWHDMFNDGSGNITKALYAFDPPARLDSPVGFYGLSFSAACLVARRPDIAGVFALKIFSGYTGDYTNGAISRRLTIPVEINYDFNPSTGVMNLKSKSPTATLQWTQEQWVPEEALWPGTDLANMSTGPCFFHTFGRDDQPMHFLNDGTFVATSMAVGTFPRRQALLRPTSVVTRFQAVNTLLHTSLEHDIRKVITEQVISPLESGGNVKGVAPVDGGEYYVAYKKTNPNELGFYYREVTGRYELHSGVTNLVAANLKSRPLTNAIRRVNVNHGIGAGVVVVPTADLDTYDIDVGDSAFCMNTQRKQWDRTQGYFETIPHSAWTDSAGQDDILLISTCTHQLETDGTISLVPQTEILYPAAIVELLKAEVQYPAAAAVSPWVSVVVCDPTFSLCLKFGWLPVTVAITYTDGNKNDVYYTYMTITPTYSDVGGRKVVTGFTILDKAHRSWVGVGAQYTLAHQLGNLMWEGFAQATFQPMRTMYYLDGDALEVHVESGFITANYTDWFSGQFRMTFADRTTHRWTDATQQFASTASGSFMMTPDNGLVKMTNWSSSTGGAATIVEGPVHNVLIGSAYPEIGWVVFFQSDIEAVFQGKAYTLPAGQVDLRDVFADPANKTIYIYAILENGVPKYEFSEEKRLETPYLLWAATVTTNNTQIVTLERHNVFAIDGHRLSDTKRGNSIPTSTGLINAEGQCSWLRSDEILP